MNILLTLPLTPDTLPLAAPLLRVLAHLGPYPANDLLLALDPALTPAQVNPLLAPYAAEGKQLFRRASFCRPQVPLPNSAFPRAYNYLFETAARHIAATLQTPFLWLDPRCVPLTRGWLASIEREYAAANKASKLFLGHILTPAANGTAQSLLALPAVYPAVLPKPIMARLMTRRGELWEKSCADLIVPQAHASQLIHCVPLGMTGEPPATAALLHIANPAPFVAKVLGVAAGGPAPVEVAQKISPLPEPIGAPVAEVVTPPPGEVAPPPNKSAFYHSGDLGDIIYALAAVKLAGGGRLLLGPQLRKTSRPQNPIKRDVFELFAPLLAAQPYLSKVAYAERHPGTDGAFDLNHYRTFWEDKEMRAKTGITTLVRAHAHLLHVDEKFHPSQTWLTAPNPIKSGMFVVHRCPRYRAPDGDFPWQMLVKRYAGRLLFVGLPQEHADFQREQQCRVAYYRCYDFLDLARVIAGADGFIGSQSFPCALALALGQRVLQESWPQDPCCIFARPNFLTQPFAETQLKVWEASRL